MSADNLNERESRGRGVYARAGVEGLRPLKELGDFKVADGEPDIRGWDVTGSDGRKIGEVHDLLVDTGAMKVRYMDVELDGEVAGRDPDDDRHVLVPIGAASLDDDRDHVRLTRLTAGQLTTLPVYDHRMLTRDQERTLLGRYGTFGADASAAVLPERDEDFYGHEYFDERRICRVRSGTGGDARYIERSR